MGSFARSRILITLAWRNLFGHKGKNAIVGVIMMFGTFLGVLGTALLDSIERSMTRSITASVAASPAPKANMYSAIGSLLPAQADSASALDLAHQLPRRGHLRPKAKAYL